MKRLVQIGVGVGLSVAAATALALPTMMLTFNTTYKTKIPAGSALSKAGCAICHAKPNGGALNPYGEDLKKAMAGSKTLTAATLKKVEDLDSDKDGVKNIDEITKGTLPGSDKSVPSKK